MNPNLYDQEVDAYLRGFTGSPADLALKASPFAGISSKELAQQLKGLRVAKHKFPGLFEQTGLLYPPAINLEQTSSEAAARYKATICSGKRMADLTGGFGVDSLAFAETFEQVIHLEKNPELAALAAYNFNLLQKDHIQSLSGSFEQHLPQGNYDLLYLDPSRRHQQKGKVFRLADYEPNPMELLPSIFDRTQLIMIKTSPLLDLSQGVRELTYVSEIHVVAVDNEVKELLWILRQDATEIMVTAVNLLKGKRIEWTNRWGNKPEVSLGMPLEYLYEPNAAILKAGIQDSLAQELGLSKLQPFTQLYTSNEMVAHFPGRILRIHRFFPYGKSVYPELKALARAEVVVRNFPLSVKEIRTKFKIKDGGDRYWYFAGAPDAKNWAIECERMA